MSADPQPQAGVMAVNGGSLPLGGGLLSIVRPALSFIEAGGVLAVISTNRHLGDDLMSWCRAERHEYLGAEDGEEGSRRHLIRRGAFGVGRSAERSDERIPPRATAESGFAPRGSAVEAGGAIYPFDVVEKDRAMPPDVRGLYEQAVAGQWSAARDIPWATIPDHSPALQLAVRQLMSFLAENELSALYVPSRFVSRIHPAYVETAMFLATQMGDESRHIDVFLERARITGAPAPISSATTSRSLHSLLEVTDFTESSFLLSVLGEGTFLDLLTFVERYAPDEATAELARRARIDESRHVHFGMAHVKHALATDETLYPRLKAAVRKRAATLAGVGGVPAPVQDALTIFAAGGDSPRQVARGHEAFRELLETMSEGRIRRLRSAGFTAEQAGVLSDLHTPNFM
jgi:TusA-related sulfurtransferase